MIKWQVDEITWHRNFLSRCNQLIGKNCISVGHYSSNFIVTKMSNRKTVFANQLITAQIKIVVLSYFANLPVYQ
jgi:hypothetical protein